MPASFTPSTLHVSSCFPLSLDQIPQHASMREIWNSPEWQQNSDSSSTLGFRVGRHLQSAENSRANLGWRAALRQGTNFKIQQWCRGHSNQIIHLSATIIACILSVDIWSMHLSTYRSSFRFYVSIRGSWRTNREVTKQGSKTLHLFHTWFMSNLEIYNCLHHMTD